MPDAQRILFGADDTPCIVAVEPGQDGAIIYRRTGRGIERGERPFTPWLLLEERIDLPGAELQELEGPGYKFIARFDGWPSFRGARFMLRDAHISHFAYPNPIRQYLTLSGQTLFKGMTFDDINRMQVDIETAGFSPDAPGNVILLIAVSDNRGFERVIEGEERNILAELIALVRELDPDVIEGHNIYGFDLPYLAKRAEMNGVRLALGRDGSSLTFGSLRNCPIGGTTRPYRPAHIYGRHIADTLLGVQRYDVARGTLASHALKDCAQVLGLAQPDRVLIPHTEILREWKMNPDRVRKYAIQDALETRALSELVSPPEFYLTQMVPDSYSSVLTTGTGEKINSILIREYLRTGHAIPKPQSPKEVPGGYTDIRMSGVIERVVKCDVESLYPSIMLTQRIKPESDTLDIFLPALEELTRRRLEAKAQMKSVQTASDHQSQSRGRAYWDGLQGSFKILINSFYGYLGAPFNFNDYRAAERVTLAGQEIVKRVVQELERSGSRVIEVDTDGVYFQPPESVSDEQAEIDYIERVGSSLPKGIRLAHDGRYRMMISLKRKNYILIHYDGHKTFKGASVRSRADERFGREFISKAVDLIVAGRAREVAHLYADLAARIRARKLSIDEFARRERVTEKTFTSSSKKRVAEAAKTARIGEYVSVYNRADGSIALAEEYAGDEDRDYLLDKLYKFACRLREAFGDDFDCYFPKPSSLARAEAAGQQTLGLFE